MLLEKKYYIDTIIELPRPIEQHNFYKNNTKRDKISNHYYDHDKLIGSVNKISDKNNNNNNNNNNGNEVNNITRLSFNSSTANQSRNFHFANINHKIDRAIAKQKFYRVKNAFRKAIEDGIKSMVDLYDRKEPGIVKKGYILEKNHPGAKLSEFSAPSNGTEQIVMGAYAALMTAKNLRNSLKFDFTTQYGRQIPPKISLRQTPLEGLCPPREPPRCMPASRRYRTHDGTCNNNRKPRWGSAQMPFHRFLSPIYADGIESMRRSTDGSPLLSARFISLLVHGSRESSAPVTLLLAQWGQFIDHDLTSTAQPRSINGSVPRCCGISDPHPNCSPIKVPRDDPWLAPLDVDCLEFLRSAPAQRRDCVLSWREQTNQVTSYLDASPIYASSARSSDNGRIFRDGLLLYGRGPAKDDVCLRGALANQCIRPGDTRSGEQPGLLAMHHVWVGEHNHIASELVQLNPHWSDEKVYQETRRIVGALFQHITYREFLPLVLGREVCRLFGLDLTDNGYYNRYDPRINPSAANSFATAAFRFGHSLIQGSYMRSDRNNNFLDNNVTLHEEFQRGDIGTAGSLHRLLRGLAMQPAQKRDEFITAELTNHLFQSGSFPFGLDLAAINIQRGRDHGLPPYVHWREPCGLSPITDWLDFERVVGPKSAKRIRQGYRTIADVDLFVAGIAERPVVGGLVGPTFACIIAQQFSNLRRGDRFWYENGGSESSFTPAQLAAIKQVLFAQVVCRTLGPGSTLQPHIFLPPNGGSNDRRICGFGSMSPINLRPWLERDPFNKNSGTVGNNPVDINVNISNKLQEQTVIDKVDLLSNGGVGIQQPDKTDDIDRLVINGTIINNKLDFNLSTRPQFTVDKIEDSKLLTGKFKRRTTSTVTPLTKATKRTKTTGTKRQKSTSTTKRTVPKIRDKRDTSDSKEGRGRIFVNLHQNETVDEDNDERMTINPYINKKTSNEDGRHIVVVTPDSESYEIEINIRPNPNRFAPTTTEKDIVHFDTDNYFDSDRTSEELPRPNRPQQDYDSFSRPIYAQRPQWTNSYDTDTYTTSGPINFNTRRPPLPARPQSVFNDYNTPLITTTIRNDIRRPTYSYADNYHRPTSDQSVFNDYNTPLTTTVRNDVRRPTYSYTDNYYRPTTDRQPVRDSTPFSYDSDERYTKPQILSDKFDYGPTTYSEHRRPIKRPTIIYLNNLRRVTSTNRPDLFTFFAIQTTTATSAPNVSDMDDTFSQLMPQNMLNNIFTKFSNYFADEKETRITKRPKTKYNVNKQPLTTNDKTDYNFEYSRQEDHDIESNKKMTKTNGNDDLKPKNNVNDNELNESFTKQKRPDDKNVTSLNQINWTDEITEQDIALLFDNDGYLRPEHMQFFMNIDRKTDREKFNVGLNLTDRQESGNYHLDDYVLPKLNETETLRILRTTNVTLKKTYLNGRNNTKETPLIIGRNRESNILASDIDSEQSEHNEQKRQFDTMTFIRQTNNKLPTRISFAPINVLTKPERPDNWVMFDAEPVEPLPELPTMETVDAITEMPRPMLV